MQIRYLNNKKIDRRRWDEIVLDSEPGLPYGFCWYLDSVSPGWDALVLNDYEAVMPLTWNRKYSINYLYQPWFTQQLGIFGPGKCDSTVVNKFLEAIPGKYRLINIRLNENNYADTGPYTYQTRKNYLLPLKIDYETLYKGFSRNCRRNIEKGRGKGLRVTRNDSALLFAMFIKKYLSDQVNNLNSNSILILHNLCKKAIETGNGEIYTTLEPGGILQAAGFFVKSEKRLIFQVCASSPEGKASQAMACLLDHVLFRYAGSGLVLDFSGSMMPGVAYFNESFGAKPVEYKAVYLNRLPKIISWLK